MADLSGFVVLASEVLKCRDCRKALEQGEAVWVMSKGGKLHVVCGACGDDEGLDRELGSLGNAWQEVRVDYPAGLSHPGKRLPKASDPTPVSRRGAPR